LFFLPKSSFISSLGGSNYSCTTTTGSVFSTLARIAAFFFGFFLPGNKKGVESKLA
jgi:hypothetical protein